MAFPLRCGTAIEPLRSRRLAPSQAALGPSNRRCHTCTSRPARIDLGQPTSVASSPRLPLPHHPPRLDGLCGRHLGAARCGGQVKVFDLRARTARAGGADGQRSSCPAKTTSVGGFPSKSRRSAAHAFSSPPDAAQRLTGGALLGVPSLLRRRLDRGGVRHVEPTTVLFLEDVRLEDG